jgi:hypothetical protein
MLKLIKDKVGVLNCVGWRIKFLLGDNEDGCWLAIKHLGTLSTLDAACVSAIRLPT